MAFTGKSINLNDYYIILYVLVKYPLRELDSRRRVPFAGHAFCSGVVSAWCRLLGKSDVWPIELFKKEPLEGNSEVHLHIPTKFGEDPPKEYRGVGEQTNSQMLLEL